MMRWVREDVDDQVGEGGWQIKWVERTWVTSKRNRCKQYPMY